MIDDLIQQLDSEVIQLTRYHPDQTNQKDITTLSADSLNTSSRSKIKYFLMTSDK